MPNRNTTPRHQCPCCGRYIRAKAGKLIAHGVGLLKAKAMRVGKSYPCEGSGRVVG